MHLLGELSVLRVMFLLTVHMTHTFFSALSARPHHHHCPYPLCTPCAFAKQLQGWDLVGASVTAVGTAEPGSGPVWSL